MNSLGIFQSSGGRLLSEITLLKPAFPCFFSWGSSTAWLFFFGIRPSVILCTWPYHLNWGRCILSTIVSWAPIILLTRRFQLFLGLSSEHITTKSPSQLHWVCLLLFFSWQVSKPYIGIGNRIDWYNCVLGCLDICFDHSIALRVYVTLTHL